ncbi:MAG: putative Ig domain-containing protein [Halieaceae bacterium]|jgi:AAA family ATP:ADP antiporter|nr:putative Ig domain-containing protein [Halieaceae bacterium]
MIFTPTERFLSLFTTLRPNEGRGVMLLCVQAFTILFVYYLLKVIRDPLILAEGSAELKSYTNAMQAAILMVVVPVFARVYHRLGHEAAKHILISRIMLFFISNVLLFAFAYNAGWPIAIAFYVWLGIFSVMVLALFWGFSADLYNVKSGQRIFPVVAAAASGGAYLGAQAAGWLNPIIGHDGTMLLAGLLLLIPWWFCGRVENTIPPGSASLIADEFHDKPPPVSEGFMVVFRSYYLTMIALFIILMNLVNTNGEYILSAFVTNEADALEAAGALVGTRGDFMTSFYSSYFAWFTLLGFLIQLFLVSRIFDRIGLKGALLVLPALMVGSYSLMLVFPILAVVRVAMIAENSISYSLLNTTRHALFLPVRREEKYVGKNCIDTFFFRCGDVLSAVAVYVGSTLVGIGLAGFIVTNLVLAAILFWFAWLIGNRNQGVIEENLGNLPPQVGLPLPDMDIPAGKVSDLVMREDTFYDPDEGDALKYHAYSHFKGGLPAWVKFDALHRRFEFAPPAGSEGSAHIRVVATDFDGAEAELSFRVNFSPNIDETKFEGSK